MGKKCCRKASKSSQCILPHGKLRKMMSRSFSLNVLTVCTFVIVTVWPFVCVYMWMSLNTGVFIVKQPGVSPLPAQGKGDRGGGKGIRTTQCLAEMKTDQSCAYTVIHIPGIYYCTNTTTRWKYLCLLPDEFLKCQKTELWTEIILCFVTFSKYSLFCK